MGGRSPEAKAPVRECGVKDQVSQGGTGRVPREDPENERYGMKTYTRILATCIVTLSLALGLTACNPKEKIDELLTPTSVEEAIAAREAQFAPTV